MASVNMSAVWDRTTEFLRDSGARLAPLVLVLIVAPLALGGVLTAIGNGMTPGTRQGVQLLTIGLSFVSMWGQLAIAAMVTGLAASAPQAGALGLGRLPKMIGVSVLLGCGFLLLFAPVLVALIRSGTDLNMLASGDPALVQLAMRAIPPSYVWFMVLWTLGVMGVILWVSTRLSLLLPVVAAENVLIAAFRRSFAMTRGLALKIFGVVLLVAVVSNITQLAAKAVFGSVFALLGGGTDPVSLGSLVTTLLVATISSAFVMLSAIFLSNLYLTVRGRAATDTPDA